MASNRRPTGGDKPAQKIAAKKRKSRLAAKKTKRSLLRNA